MRATHLAVSILLILLGAALAAGGWWAQQRLTFEGEILLPLGQPEQVVLAIAGTNGHADARDLTAADVPLNNPETAGFLPGAGLFDAAMLPFALRLDRIERGEERPASNRLYVNSEGLETSLTLPGSGAFSLDVLAADTAVSNDVLEGEVIELQPWRGLLPVQHGSPMAHIALEHGGVRRELFLHHGVWQYPLEGFALRFDWFEDETAAGAAFPEESPGLDAARWGVVEHDLVHWNTSFVPGNSVTLLSGTEVALLEVQEEPPAISAVVRRDGAEERVTVPANDAAHPLLRFEHPGAADAILRLHGFEGGALMRVYRDGAASTRGVALREPTPLAPEDERRVEVLALASSALPVTEEDAELWQAVLRVNGEVVALREEAPVRWRDYELSYRREPAGPRLGYHLSALRKGGRFGANMLWEGESWQIGRWTFTAEGEQKSPEPQRYAALKAVRATGNSLYYGGAICAAVGLFALLGVPRMRRTGGG